MEPSNTNQHFFAHPLNRWLGTAVLLVMVVALLSYAHLTQKEAQYLKSGPTTIVVSGEGEAFAVPDTGEFLFSVIAEGDTATVAQERSATAMNAILAYLKEAGVEERDVKTQYYNLNPKYRYEERVCVGGGYCPPGERKLDGFEVNQTVRVKVRSTEDAGALISGVGERGATNISSLQFTIDDDAALVAEARAAAITDAKEKAAVLAADLGVRLVRMVGYQEAGGYIPEAYAMKASMDMDEGFGGSIAPAVPTGENRVTSSVVLTYEVQ